MLSKVPSSFRDPSGYVYTTDSRIIRSVELCYKEHFEAAEQSGLFRELFEKKYIVHFALTKEEQPYPAWAWLEVDKIPYITYPYEWSFPQLKKAALLTLNIQKIALAHNMTLKDASAYNVQFHNGQAKLIDILSFEKYDGCSPWQAYRQFCMHFLAPLALLSHNYPLTRLSALWIDGIPLDMTWAMLPWKAKLSLGLQMHLHLHAKAEKKFSDGRIATKYKDKATLSKKQLSELIDSLIRTVESLQAPKVIGEWANYYQDTNYTHKAQAHKEEIINHIAHDFKGEIALDLGANTGRYSHILSKEYGLVIAADIDNSAVAAHYEILQENNIDNVLPIVLDLSNPSPAIGWACNERASFVQRTSVDLICALAISHHIFFTCGIPWQEQAQFFCSILKPNACLVIEFIPKEDSQVQRLLAGRDDIFLTYTEQEFLKAFLTCFDQYAQYDLEESQRKCFVFIKK